MNPNFIRHNVPVQSNALLDYLSAQQHVQPHRSIRSILDRAVPRLDLCPTAVARSIRSLGVNDATPIGRLRRTELTQLARCAQRLSRQLRLHPIPLRPRRSLEPAVALPDPH